MFERVYHEAGAGTPMWLSYDQIVGLIRGAGKTPVERDSLNQPVRRFEDWVPGRARFGRRDPTDRRSRSSIARKPTGKVDAVSRCWRMWWTGPNEVTP